MNRSAATSPACSRRTWHNLSAFLKSSFDYDTGSFEPATDNTPQKRCMLRSDLNINNSNKFSFNYVQLDSSSDNILSGSTSAGIGRRTVGTDFMNYRNSNYAILENRKTGTGEWNSVIGSTMSNTLRVDYSSSDESRPQNFDVCSRSSTSSRAAPPTSRSAASRSRRTTSCATSTFEVKNDFTKFGTKHELTFGGRVERYHSDNVFFNCCKQGAWIYNSLDDFYADARGCAGQPEPHDCRRSRRASTRCAT